MSDETAATPVGFLLRGVWEEHAVRVAVVPSTRRTERQVEAAIDDAWRAAIARPGLQLFDGPVCRLEAFRVQDERLAVDVSATTYRINVGTNFVNPQLADDFGPDVMANPLGVSAGLISADDYLIFGRRNATVAYYPHRLHPFAGSVEVRDEINLFDDCRRELREEIAHRDEWIAHMHLIGLVEDRRLRHPEAIFRVRSTRTRDEIQSAVDPAEHGASEAWPCNAKGLSSLLDRVDVTPVGHAIARRLLDLL